MARNFEEFIRIADRWGLTEVLLPFLLIFVVMYAVLTKTKVLGETKKNLIVIVAIVFLLVLIGVFGHEQVFLGMTMPGWVMLLSVITIAVIFGSAAGWWQPGITQSIQNFFGADSLSIVILILLFGIIIAYITSEPKEGPSQGLKKAGIDLDKLFKK